MSPAGWSTREWIQWIRVGICDTLSVAFVGVVWSRGCTGGRIGTCWPLRSPRKFFGGWCWGWVVGSPPHRRHVATVWPISASGGVPANRMSSKLERMLLSTEKSWGKVCGYWIWCRERVSNSIPSWAVFVRRYFIYLYPRAGGCKKKLERTPSVWVAEIALYLRVLSFCQTKIESIFRAEESRGWGWQIMNNSRGFSLGNFLVQRLQC